MPATPTEQHRSPGERPKDESATSALSHVLKTQGWWGFGKRVLTETGNDQMTTWAAAMAYSWLFAIFPFAIFLLTLVPYLPLGDPGQIQQELTDFIRRSLPGEASAILVDVIPEILHQRRGGLLSLGILIAIWTASSGMAMTMSALNRAYDLSEDRAFHRQRLVAILLTTATAVLILAVLVLLPIAGIAIAWLENHGMMRFSTPLAIVLNIVRWAAAVLLMMLVVSLVYYFGPRAHGAYRFISPGGIFTVAVWIIMGLLFQLYIDRFGSYGETYGAVGGVIVLLLFMYIVSLVLLVGAEINSEIDLAVHGREAVVEKPTGRKTPSTAKGLSGEPSAREQHQQDAGERRADLSQTAALHRDRGHHDPRHAELGHADPGRADPGRADPRYVEPGSSRPTAPARPASAKAGYLTGVIGSAVGLTLYLLSRRGRGRDLNPALSRRHTLARRYPLTWRAMRS